MHRNLSKHASRVQRSVPYYLIFILILSGALDLFIFSFFSLEKNHFFKRFVLASDFEKHPFVVRNREPIRPQKGATASLMVAATSDMHGSLGILCVINCNEVKGLFHLAPLKNFEKRTRRCYFLMAETPFREGSFNFTSTMFKSLLHGMIRCFTR